MPEQKQINLPKFEILPSGKYAGCTCKRPYNLLSIAILLLDPAVPGYFLNIPPVPVPMKPENLASNCVEPIFGRGNEVAIRETYFLIVAVLKIIALLIIYANIINDGKDDSIITNLKFGGSKDSDGFTGWKRYAITFGTALAINLLIPLISQVVYMVIYKSEISNIIVMYVKKEGKDAGRPIADVELQSYSTIIYETLLIH